MRPLDAFTLGTLLFVPATNARFVEKAPAAGADAIIVDLEDAVPESDKVRAREGLAGVVAALRAKDQLVVVRVNRGDEADLEACASARPDGIVLPKVEGADEVRTAIDRLAAGLAAADLPALFPTIETPRGVLESDAIAGVGPPVAGLMFGTEDFAFEMGGIAGDPTLLTTTAVLLAIAAKANGIAVLGLPGTIADHRDLDGLAAAAARGRAIGFSGAAGIHPDQIPVLARAFAPGEDELARARRVVAEFEASDRGAISVDGKFVDRPIYLSAKRTIERAGG